MSDSQLPLKLQWIAHNDQLLHSRISFWIAAQSLGYAILVATIEATKNADPAVFAAALGIATCVVWFFSGLNIGLKVRKASTELASEWPYLSHFNEAGSKVFTSFVWLVVILPLVFLGAWVGIFVKAVTGA